MTQTLRFVSSVKANVPEVWTTLARARSFVVSPYASLHARFDRNAELTAGRSILAKLVAGPLALSDPWRVQTHDRDGSRLAINGAEGFDGHLLWDYEILLGEAGPRCIIDCRVKLPSARQTPWGICVSRMFDRRHLSMKSTLRVAQIAREAELRQATEAALQELDGRASGDMQRRLAPPPCSFITLPLYRQPRRTPA